MSRKTTRTNGNENRVLVLAPTGRDGIVLCRTLSAANIPALECPTTKDLCERLGEGAGAAIVAEEALSGDARRAVAAALAEHPPWSELPLIVMGVQGGRLGPARELLEEVKGSASAIFLHRPIHTEALLSVVRSGLQSRARQYQIRDELIARAHAETALRESERRLRELNQSLERRVAERTEELEHRARQLRQLAQELTGAEQRERKKLAQTLHDGLQQILIAIKMQLAFSSDEDRLVTPAGLNQLLDQAIEITKGLAYELSPPILHDSDLAGALKWLGRWFSENQRLTVRLEVDSDLPSTREGMKLFLFDAIRELLLNAVKHSRVRAATVRLRVHHPKRIPVEVEDEGAGFDPARLWETDSKGLGLFSIQERLAALGGHLEINSSPGAGARFVLSLPPEETETLGASPEPTPTLVKARDQATRSVKMRVMVVDDHRIFREGLVSMLRHQDEFEFVGEATDGWEAVYKTEELRPDVVVMDISMPKLDGIESTRRIKQTHPEIHIIGLSVHEDREKAEAMLRAGASMYLRKVDAARTLFNAIRTIGGGGAPETRRGA